MRSRQAWFPVACVGVTAQLPGSGCSSGRPGWGGLGGCAGGFSSSWHWFGGDSVLCVLGVGVGDVRQGRSFAGLSGGGRMCFGPRWVWVAGASASGCSGCESSACPALLFRLRSWLPVALCSFAGVLASCRWLHWLPFLRLLPLRWVPRVKPIWFAGRIDCSDF